MGKTKSSQLPWTAEDDLEGPIILSVDGRVIASLGLSDCSPAEERETKENARLLIRAVNSHEALKRALEVMVRSSERADEVGSPAQAVAVAQARATLALAEASNG